MKKILIFLLAILTIFILFSNVSFTGKAISEKETLPKLGYCPTMFEKAYEISKENQVEIIEFSSSVKVLNVLNKNEIEMGLIGRKANQNEISKNIKETIIESGYTLISKERTFLKSSELETLEIYTYLKNMENTIPESKIIYHNSKEEAMKFAFENNKPVLISWEDWKDDFNLAVVFEGEGPEKDKRFRGAFLYEI